MSETTYYQRNRETINIYNYLHKKKNIKREYGRNRYLNMSEEKKQTLKKYQNIIMKLLEADSLNLIKKCMSTLITNCSFCWLFFLIFIHFFLIIFIIFSILFRYYFTDFSNLCIDILYCFTDFSYLSMKFLNYFQ